MLFSVSFLILASLVQAVPLDKKDSLAGILSWKKKLTFDKNGKFKLVSFSDMHFGERWGNGSWSDWGTANDLKTQRVHATILDQEKPNHVVFNGDMMTGENTFADNSTGYLDQCFKPTVDRRITFSTTHGNHDNADHINHQREIEYEQTHYSDLSYTRMDVGNRPWGVGNYWLPIYEHDWDFKPAALMWFFDSRSFVSGTGNGPGPVPDDAKKYWVDETTVPYYIESQALLMKLLWGEVPPSLIFVHIPFQKVQNMTSLPTAGDHDDEPDPSTQGYPSGDYYNGLDLKTYDQLVKISGGKNKVMAITSGHDHGESWCGRSKVSNGLSICFNGHSGYGGYETEHSKVRNGRVFNLDIKAIKKDSPTVDTWNSYEDKTTGEHVTLGKDYLKEYN